MKILIACLLLSLAMEVASAKDYEFQVHRFCAIQLKTNDKKGHVEIEIYPKAVSETEILLRSSLKKVADGSYETPGGIRFTLKRLPKEIIRDHNRHINSGDWELVITGSGTEYQKLKGRLVPISTFRTANPELPVGHSNPEMPDMSYYGSIKEVE